MIRLFIALLLTFIGLPAQSQQALPDSGTLSLPIQQAITLYHQDAGWQSQLYNGRTHIRYEAGMIGIPYYLSLDPQTGSVTFDNILFENVPLWYDAVREKLVVQHFNKISAFELNSERVSRFSIGSHLFLRIVRDSANESTPPASFYEVLCQGPLTILARRRKMIAEFIENMEVKHRVDDKETFYAFKDGIYYPVNNERSLLAIVKERRSEVQQFLKKNKIKFRKTPELALVKAGNFYNQTSPH